MLYFACICDLKYKKKVRFERDSLNGMLSVWLFRNWQWSHLGPSNMCLPGQNENILHVLQKTTTPCCLAVFSGA